MRGEHVVGSKMKSNGKAKNLTWVKGDRDPAALDDTSRKILKGGRRQFKIKSEPSPTDWQNEGGARAGSIWHGGSSESNAKVAEVTSTGTSIFDPVLCELVYTWFCPPRGAILDPFAGGSVRGVVAAYLGHKYTGLDLRPEQIAANRAQAKNIVPKNPPTWLVGNSLTALPPGPFDLVFSCPPYFDLEVYGDDPADLSAYKGYDAFAKDYGAIIAQCVARLRPERFACFVVGDIRDKKGLYRNFPADTIAAFQAAGAALYNEAVLITAVGSLPIRVGRQFSAGRKLGKTHQNVLIFFKGDPAKIGATFGDVDVSGAIEMTEADAAGATGL